MFKYQLDPEGSKSLFLLRHKILLVPFLLLLANWVIILVTTRVNDVPLSAELGLLSLLPLNFVAALFITVSLTLLSIYWHDNVAAILFALLFAFYFAGTAWLIEPLRLPDSLFHFSRVAVVNSYGHIPTITKYYFEFPLSTSFGTMLLQITSLDNLFFLEVFFPLLTMALFLFGMSIIVFRLFRDLRVVSITILFLSVFGYAAQGFSPAAFAEILFPFMLLTIGRKKYVSCYLVLALALVMSNPTTNAFIICFFIVYLAITGLVEHHVNRLLVFEILLFMFACIAWFYIFSNNFTMNQIQVFLQQVGNLINGRGTIEGLAPPTFPLLGISYARRIFVVITGSTAVFMLFISTKHFFKRLKGFPSYHPPLNFMIGPSIMIVGLLLTLLFYLGLPQNPFGTRSISFYCLGISLSAGFLSLKSKRIILVIAIVLTSLVIPAFLFTYPQEQYDIIRSPIIKGLQFTGTQINSNPGIVLCPFGQELQSFTKLSAWDSINTLSIPYYGKQSYGYDLRTANYFVYRLDAEYYSYLNAETSKSLDNGGTTQPASYIDICLAVKNSEDYNQIYSSGSYSLFARNSS